jgi:hypothetical protein
MSNDQNNQNITSSSLPSSTELVETLFHLVHHMVSLERRLRESSPTETANPERDSFITERAPDTEFIPYPDFSQALPSFKKDFFRNPLPEMERRRVLCECPRNVGREYTPTPINSANTNQTEKRYGSQLVDVQFRLSGTTQPLDSFLHKILRNGAVSSSEAMELLTLFMNHYWTPLPLSPNFALTTCSVARVSRVKHLAWLTPLPHHYWILRSSWNMSASTSQCLKLIVPRHRATLEEKRIPLLIIPDPRMRNRTK